MRYNFINFDKKNKAVLISANGVRLWVDYYIDDDLLPSWEFNQYIFFMHDKNDKKVKEIQNKIYEDLENFDAFMDKIFEKYLNN